MISYIYDDEYIELLFIAPPYLLKLVYANIRSWLIYIEPGAKIMKIRTYSSCFFLQNEPPVKCLACLDMWAKYTQ